MKTFLDALYMFAITATGLAATAFAGPDVNGVDDLTRGQLLFIVLTSISTTLKGIQSYKSDPSKPAE